MENWCYREFQAFDDWSSRNHLKSFKRYYFVLTEGDVFPAKFPPAYGEWKKKIDGYLHIEDLSSLNKKRVREEVYKIAREIEKTREQALDRYIDG
jgi:hypothetical protein